MLQCAVENEELVQHLGAAKDAQRQLTAEVSGSSHPTFTRPFPVRAISLPLLGPALRVMSTSLAVFNSESKVILTRKFLGGRALHSPPPAKCPVSEMAQGSP